MLERVSEHTGPIIASRSYLVDGEPDALMIEIAKPRRARVDWRVTMGIQRGRARAIVKFGGVDSMQCLNLCMKLVGRVVNEIGNVTFLDASNTRVDL